MIPFLLMLLLMLTGSLKAQNSETLESLLLQMNADSLHWTCRTSAVDLMLFAFPASLMKTREAFLKAIEKSDTYRRLGSFEAWLMRINLNTTLDYLRRQPQFVPFVEPAPRCAPMDG